MNSINTVLQNLENFTTKFAIGAAIIAAVLLLLYLFLKYRKKNIGASIALQHTLQAEVDENHGSRLTIAANAVAKGATVTYNNDGSITLSIPTKLWWQAGSKVDVSNEISRRIKNNDGFQHFLETRFSKFVFSEPIDRKNMYIINGTKVR